MVVRPDREALRDKAAQTREHQLPVISTDGRDRRIGERQMSGRSCPPRNEMM